MISLAVNMYAQANDGKCPPTRFTTPDQDPNAYDGVFWANFLNEGRYATSRNDTTGVYMCPNATDELETNYYDPNQTSRTYNSGYFNMKSSENPQGITGNLKDIKCSYAVNGTDSNGDMPWWPGNAYNPGPVPRKYYSELYPFVIWLGSPTVPDYMRPIAPKITNIKNSTRIPLVFDGFFMHGSDPARIKLRHGNLRGAEKDRLCNFVFIDGHAESIRGGDLPVSNADPVHPYPFFTPKLIGRDTPYGVVFAAAPQP